MVKIIVLGAAAGGGLPQWNCNCEVCCAARAGDGAAAQATQSSLAVSADGVNWFLLNASPDLRQQINQTPALHPRRGRRHSPIAGVVLTNADVDHVAGLLTLRESQPLSLYGTERVLAVLSRNNIFDVLNPDFVRRTPLPLNTVATLNMFAGTPSGLEVEAFPVPGKVALYLEDEGAGPNFGSIEEDTIGLRVMTPDREKSFFYIPGCAGCPPDVKDRLKGAGLLFFDGTTWTDDEMQTSGVGHKTGRRMGHTCMSGDAGSIASLADIDIGRRIFIHINNTNPVFLKHGVERAAVEGAGWELAYDGMEIEL